MQASLIMVIDSLSKKIAETIFFEQEYLDIILLRNKVFDDFKCIWGPSIEKYDMCSKGHGSSEFQVVWHLEYQHCGLAAEWKNYASQRPLF